MMYYYKVNNDKCNKLVIRDKEILSVNEPGWYITDVSYKMNNDVDEIIVTVQKFESKLSFGSTHTAASRSCTNKDDRALSTNKRKRRRKKNDK